MEYSFLFLLMQKLWKSIKKCKTYSRKATGRFLARTRCICNGEETGTLRNVSYIYFYINKETTWVLRRNKLRLVLWTTELVWTCSRNQVVIGVKYNNYHQKYILENRYELNKVLTLFLLRLTWMTTGAWLVPLCCVVLLTVQKSYTNSVINATPWH